MNEPDEGIDESELSPEDIESAKAGEDADGKRGRGKVNHWFTVEVSVSIDVAQILFAVIGVPVVGAVLLAWVAS